MCTICETLRSWSEPCAFGESAGKAGPVLSSGHAFGTTAEIAQWLAAGFWGMDRLEDAARWTRLEEGAALRVDLTGLMLSSAVAVQAALDGVFGMMGYDFVPVTSGADITFRDDLPGAYAARTRAGSDLLQVEVVVGRGWLSDWGTGYGDYGFQTLVHEIGHALGLGHAGPYNGAARFDSHALFGNDSYQVSTMSYFRADMNPLVTGSALYPATLMPADIMALEQLYGVASDLRAGDTVYGVGSTAGGIYDALPEILARSMATVLDSGGRDLLDLSDDRADQRVDLRPGALSDVYGLVGNLAIYDRSWIEAVRLGAGDDAIRGNAADNRIDGGSGVDTAIFAAPSLEATVRLRADGVLEVISAADGRDGLSAVERLSFADRDIPTAWITGRMAESGRAAGQAVTLAALAGEGDPGDGALGDPSRTGDRRLAADPPGGAAREARFDPAQARGMLEIGRATVDQAMRSTWTQVSFAAPIPDAVVVLGPAIGIGRDGGVLELGAVSATGFEVRLSQFAGQDGISEPVGLSWMAASRGAHTLDDGSQLVFGRTAVEGASLEVHHTRLGAPDDALVFASLAERGGPDPLSVALNVHSDRFTLHLQSDERATISGVTGTGVANWVAVSPGSALASGRGVVDANGGELAVAPRAAVFADIQQPSAGDPSVLRLDPLGDRFVLRAEEDTVLDRESFDTAVDIAWLAAATGRAATETPLPDAPAEAPEIAALLTESILDELQFTFA